MEVTNLANGRSAVLRVNDRGPFSDNRIIDLSRGAADQLGLLSQGVGQVRVRYLGRAPRNGGGRNQQASATQGEAQLPPARSPVEPPSRYWVHAGAFSDPLAARLSADNLGDMASVTPTEVEGRRLYRVLVGPWSDANSAEQARQTIVGRGVRDALLISGR